jgi:murein DD-endopeptidase MepM/ murein hydrolase activator NlpD
LTAVAPAVDPRRGTGAGVMALGRRGVSELEHVLASAGVDVGRLFSQFGVSRGEGGPFVPPRKGDAEPEASHDKLAALHGLIKSLPLATPLEEYQLESGFGARHDPINHRSSFHTGLDFSAPYMTPVYATAPGVVSFAGYYGEYGKIVDIDHGNGIETRYAHLHRYTVSVGQKVGLHAQIGYLGTTGRSTGPHVHYEVLVNGEPQDPEKFLGLAHLIPVAAR